DRVVPDGTALAAAVELAKQIAAFPQICMNSDRLSAYRQWDFEIEGALAHDAHAGVAPLREGAAAGAKRFTDGAGRGGSFAPSRRTDGSGMGSGRFGSPPASGRGSEDYGLAR